MSVNMIAARRRTEATGWDGPPLIKSPLASEPYGAGPSRRASERVLPEEVGYFPAGRQVHRMWTDADAPARITAPDPGVAVYPATGPTTNAYVPFGS
jgi:hypothetical protein